MKNKYIAILLIISLISFGNSKHINVEADNATTSVQVGNTVPSFSVNPYEDPASTSSSPTNEGDNVVFKATAQDNNGDDWKLLICSSNSVTGTNCTATEYCHSSFASSTSQATCSYQATSTDSWSNEWWGFACDSIGCSDYSQGSGDTGSPFYTNHRPTFTAISDCGSANPNASCLISASSTDSDGTISLYVCKTAGFSTSTPGCTGDTWCSITGQSSHPSCTISNVPRPDGSYNYYPYIIDSFKLPANSSYQGGTENYNVNNVAPSLTSGNIYLKDTDGSGNLALINENAETNGFIVTFIVTDDNSCQNISSGDEITSAIINVRMSEIAQASCDESGEYNANNCYPDTYASWNPVCAASSTVNSCTGVTDTDVGWACTFPLQYHADPTVAGTPKAAYNWVAAVQAIDDDSAASSLTDGSNTNEMDTFMAYDLASTTLAYGTVGANSDSDEKTTDIRATGNVGLDETLQGTNMCTDYPTCSGNIIQVEQQHYAASSGLGWGSMIALSSTTANELEINCLKTTITGTPAATSTYWVLRVPSGQATGTYTGQNYIIGKTDEAYGGS